MRVFFRAFDIHCATAVTLKARSPLRYNGRRPKPRNLNEDSDFAALVHGDRSCSGLGLTENNLTVSAYNNLALILLIAEG